MPDFVFRHVANTKGFAMETSELNEYLFANLVAEWAVIPRARRLKAAGVTEIGGAQFTSEDLADALRRLQQCRAEVLSLLRAEPPAGPAP